MKLNQITAVILAGGLGTRLRSVIGEHPKALSSVKGEPFLSYLFDYLIQFGIRDVLLCTGYKGEEIEAYYGGSYSTLQLRYSREPTPLGTAGALSYALPKLTSSPILVMNGDTFIDLNLEHFFDFHLGKGSNATLALIKSNGEKRFGDVQIDATQSIVSFGSKDNFESTQSITHTQSIEWINGGVYLIERAVIESIPTGRAVSIEQEVFPTLIKNKFFGYLHHEGNFIDIGTPQSLEQAEFAPFLLQESVLSE